MPQTIDADKAAKTGVVLFLANLLFIPITYAIDSKVGAATALVLTAGLMGYFNELGKERRPGSNAINRINNFFSTFTGDPNTDLLNTTKNIVNGGAATFDAGAEFVVSNLHKPR